MVSASRENILSLLYHRISMVVSMVSPETLHILCVIGIYIYVFVCVIIEYSTQSIGR